MEQYILSDIPSHSASSVPVGERSIRVRLAGVALVLFEWIYIFGILIFAQDTIVFPLVPFPDDSCRVVPFQKRTLPIYQELISVVAQFTVAPAVGTTFHTL